MYRAVIGSGKSPPKPLQCTKVVALEGQNWTLGLLNRCVNLRSNNTKLGTSTVDAFTLRNTARAQTNVSSVQYVQTYNVHDD